MGGQNNLLRTSSYNIGRRELLWNVNIWIKIFMQSGSQISWNDLVWVRAPVFEEITSLFVKHLQFRQLLGIFPAPPKNMECNTSERVSNIIASFSLPGWEPRPKFPRTDSGSDRLRSHLPCKCPADSLAPADDCERAPLIQVERPGRALRLDGHPQQYGEPWTAIVARYPVRQRRLLQQLQPLLHPDYQLEWDTDRTLRQTSLRLQFYTAGEEVWVKILLPYSNCSIHTPRWPNVRWNEE